MAKKDDDKRPIIIKKIKKGGHGHHGGAWKVAYADFVTAMMAFFLLLWLLSSSSKATLEGIAEYFTPTIGVKDKEGIGFTGGTTISEDGIRKNDSAPVAIMPGATPQGVVADVPEQSMTEAAEEAALFEKAQAAVKATMADNAQLAENIYIEQTPEGLKIDIVDSEKHPMFVPGRGELTPEGQAVLSRMLPIIKKMPNYMSISGHTDASPIDNKNPSYTNWELSADRANAARRYMIEQGMESERPKKVVGMADREPLDEEDPRNPKNRRISIVMLKGSHLALPTNFFPKTE